MIETAETCDQNWLYAYNRSKPLLSQTVYNHQNGSILNISKIYTNNVYFGVNIFLAINNQINTPINNPINNQKNRPINNHVNNINKTNPNKFFQ